MTTQQPSEIWSLRTVWFCMLAIVLATFITSFLVYLTVILSLGYESYLTFRNSPANRTIHYASSRLVALLVCLWFAKARTRRDFTSAFALRPSAPRILILAGMLGLWIGCFLRVTELGALAHIQFHLSIGSLLLLVGPFFEETVMRGFFYPAFRNAVPLVVSILLVFAIDTLLFHYRTLRIPQALVGVGIVNVVTCLLRERTKNLWPSITFHTAYNLPFAVFEWMR
jgi:membrane protease YdiL (CAAX protease family)